MNRIGTVLSDPARMHGELLLTVRQTGDAVLVDLTEVAVFSPAIIEILMQVLDFGREVEILNPSPEVMDYLRGVVTGPVLIRGETRPAVSS